jgi:uncharacterized protein (TIGR02996 family)
MTERDRLLFAIASEPDDDTPRRIFADWLDDHDEPERATFLRTGLELAALDQADPRYPATLAAHRRAWRPPSRPWEDHIPGARVSFHRGMITCAIFDYLSEFAKGDPASFQQVPLEELCLVNAGGITVAEVCNHPRPEWNRLRLLALCGSWNGRELQTILTHPSLKPLRELRLEHLIDDDSALQTLADSLDLPALEALSWRGGSPQHYPLLVSAFAPLRRLLCECHSDPELPEDLDTWGWLLGSHHWPTLEHINMWHDINTTYCGSIVHSEPVPDFSTHFADKTPTDLRVCLTDLNHLTQMPNAWQNLRTLRIGHNALNEDLISLRDCPHTVALRCLDLQPFDGSELDPRAFVPDLFEQAAFR